MGTTFKRVDGEPLRHPKFDNMSEPRHRKLTAMGVSCLVSTGKREVLDRFAFEIANIWLDVLGEIQEQENQREDERCVPPCSRKSVA